jgi:hypothetical protein
MWRAADDETEEEEEEVEEEDDDAAEPAAAAELALPPASSSNPASALMTFPRASKLLLMDVASLSLSPVAWVRFALSLPAKSTKWIRDVFRSNAPPDDDVASIDDNDSDDDGAALGSLSAATVCSMVIVKIAWLRDDRAFMAVEAVCRAAMPRRRQAAISEALVTRSDSTPVTTVSPLSFSLMTTEVAAAAPVFERRSYTASLYISRHDADTEKSTTPPAPRWRLPKMSDIKRGAIPKVEGRDRSSSEAFDVAGKEEAMEQEVEEVEVDDDDDGTDPSIMVNVFPLPVWP